MPKIIASEVIGTYAGQPMHRRSEQFEDGSVRSFEDYVTSVYSPSLGRDIGLTLVREI